MTTPCLIGAENLSKYYIMAKAEKALNESEAWLILKGIGMLEHIGSGIFDDIM